MGGSFSKRQALRVASITGLGAGATLGMAGIAHADAYTVGTANDTSSVGDCASDNTDCSLRQAITLANANMGADTIGFHTGLSGTLTLGSDLPTITDPVTIQGPGASAFTISGNDAHRIFDLNPGTAGDPVAISGLTLLGGDPTSSGVDSDSGGGILNETADLSLSDAVLTGNTSSRLGAAIYSGFGDTPTTGHLARLKVTRSTISGNTTPVDTFAFGGTVYFNYGGGGIYDSTVSGNNTADAGAGVSIFEMQAPVTIENSTIANNHIADGAADGYGGGIYIHANYSGITISNTTIAGNSGVFGGGIMDNGADNDTAPVLQNTIVAGNTAANGPDLFNAHVTAFDAAFSLFGNTAGGTVNSTVSGSNLFAVDPKLGSLANNGGPTQTMAPLAGSAAIDKGSRFGLNTDQRALTRPIDLADYKNSTAAGADGSDIGAVELQTSPGGGDVVPAPPATKKKCKKKKHKRSAGSAKKKKCKKKKRK
jgi:parallel beta helix pectate lyase-like protein